MTTEKNIYRCRQVRTGPKAHVHQARVEAKAKSIFDVGHLFFNLYLLSFCVNIPLHKLFYDHKVLRTNQLYIIVIFPQNIHLLRCPSPGHIFRRRRWRQPLPGRRCYRGALGVALHHDTGSQRCQGGTFARANIQKQKINSMEANNLLKFVLMDKCCANRNNILHQKHSY